VLERRVAAGVGVLDVEYPLHAGTALLDSTTSWVRLAKILFAKTLGQCAFRVFDDLAGWFAGRDSSAAKTENEINTPKWDKMGSLRLADLLSKKAFSTS
jgi:hypothetical protein